MIPIEQRNLIIQLDKKGKTQQEIAELLDCNQSSVSRLLYKYEHKGHVKDLPRSGRPTKLTKEKLLYLKEKILTKIRETNEQYCAVNTKQIRDLIHQKIGEIY